MRWIKSLSAEVLGKPVVTEGKEESDKPRRRACPYGNAVRLWERRAMSNPLVRFAPCLESGGYEAQCPCLGVLKTWFFLRFTGFAHLMSLYQKRSMAT